MTVRPSSELDLLADRLITGLALVPAAANVVMQLSRYPVGRAVVESRVESGALTRHPVKRTRTTLTYLALALSGTDDERAALRRDVSRVHREVRARIDSPVPYDALDPELQLWVAACLYRGACDVLALYGTEPDKAARAALYERSSRLATTLQVPEGAWPTDPADFATYWRASLQDLAVDDATRRYLVDLVNLRFMPRPVSMLAGGLHRRYTIALLEPRFRDLLGLGLSPRAERRARRELLALARLYAYLPRPVRSFPWNWVLFDARRRLSRGRSLV